MRFARLRFGRAYIFAKPKNICEWCYLWLRGYRIHHTLFGSAMVKPKIKKDK